MNTPPASVTPHARSLAPLVKTRGLRDLARVVVVLFVLECGVEEPFDKLRAGPVVRLRCQETRGTRLRQIKVKSVGQECPTHTSRSRAPRRNPSWNPLQVLRDLNFIPPRKQRAPLLRNRPADLHYQPTARFER